ncbi:MAG: hypothetical protein WCX96_04500 [Bacilli bacterium]
MKKITIFLILIIVLIFINETYYFFIYKLNTIHLDKAQKTELLQISDEEKFFIENDIKRKIFLFRNFFIKNNIDFPMLNNKIEIKKKYNEIFNLKYYEVKFDSFVLIFNKNGYLESIKFYKKNNNSYSSFLNFFGEEKNNKTDFLSFILFDLNKIPDSIELLLEPTEENHLYVEEKLILNFNNYLLIEGNLFISKNSFFYYIPINFNGKILSKIKIPENLTIDYKKTNKLFKYKFLYLSKSFLITYLLFKNDWDNNSFEYNETIPTNNRSVLKGKIQLKWVIPNNYMKQKFYNFPNIPPTEFFPESLTLAYVYQLNYGTYSVFLYIDTINLNYIGGYIDFF